MHASGSISILGVQSRFPDSNGCPRLPNTPFRGASHSEENGDALGVSLDRMLEMLPCRVIFLGPKITDAQTHHMRRAWITSIAFSHQGETFIYTPSSHEIPRLLATRNVCLSHGRMLSLIRFPRPRVLRRVRQVAYQNPKV